MTTRIKKQKGCSHPDCGCACCCSPCVKDCYRIKDYTTTLFSQCEDFYECSGAEWDGVFQFDVNIGECKFRPNGAVDYDPYSFCINGQLAEAGSDRTICSDGDDFDGVWLIGDNCWSICIAIATSELGARQSLWRGTKSGGSTPVGIYTRTGGCSAGPETIEIEECEGAGYAYPIASCYQIEGYSDGDLTGCEDCSESGLNPWDGKFNVSNDEDYNETCFWVPTPGELSIDGRYVNPSNTVENCVSATTGYPIIIRGCPPEVVIACPDDSGNCYLIWHGTRSAAHEDYPDDPVAGIYSRTDGCDGTSSLSIIPC